MTKVIKKRLLTIVLYLVPILLTVVLTKTTTYFLLCSGIMTILLGLSMKFIPGYLGYARDKDKYNGPICLSISGFCLMITACFELTRLWV